MMQWMKLPAGINEYQLMDNLQEPLRVAAVVHDEIPKGFRSWESSATPTINSSNFSQLPFIMHPKVIKH